MKEFVPKDEADRPPKGGGRNIERAHKTHASTAHPDARLFRRGLGKKAKLCHMGIQTCWLERRPDGWEDHIREIFESGLLRRF
jgi:hypothetical protein